MTREAELEQLIYRTFPKIGEVSIEGLLRFYREVMKWNSTVNLVSRRRPEETALRLIIDSLFLVGVVEENEHVLDIGAGAGFPGIPVGLCVNVEMVLTESRRKRAAFLSHVVRLLNMGSTRVINETINNSSVQALGLFDVLWSRAALSLESLFSLGRLCLHGGGRLILFRSFKGKEEKGELGVLAETHGFLPPVFNVYSCPDLYLTRTLAVCQSATQG